MHDRAKFTGFGTYGEYDIKVVSNFLPKFGKAPKNSEKVPKFSQKFPKCSQNLPKFRNILGRNLQKQGKS